MQQSGNEIWALKAIPHSQLLKFSEKGLHGISVFQKIYKKLCLLGKLTKQKKIDTRRILSVMSSANTYKVTLSIILSQKPFKKIQCLAECKMSRYIQQNVTSAQLNLQILRATPTMDNDFVFCQSNLQNVGLSTRVKLEISLSPSQYNG